MKLSLNKIGLYDSSEIDNGLGEESACLVIIVSEGIKTRIDWNGSGSELSELDKGGSLVFRPQSLIAVVLTNLVHVAGEDRDGNLEV